LKDGLLLIDKEPGCTSHDVVQRARRILKQKKIGHCGTLDPEATGLLLLTLGLATRLTRFLIRAPKVYQGTIRFGIETDTYDAVGQVIAEAPAEAVAALTLGGIEPDMRRFEGTFEQRAPPYSAKKVGGVKFYEMARRGEEVPQESKEVTVYEFAPRGLPLADGDGGGEAAPALVDGRLPFRLACTSGTYARTLAHDLGRGLGVGAHLCELRRMKIGPFEVHQAVTLSRLDAQVQAGEGVGEAYVPFDQIPLPFGEVTADPQQEQRISHGQTVLVRELAGEEGDWVKLINRRREFIAVGTVIERIGAGGVGLVQPKVVFR
jgi:tRNA pseudouridine55 synthase